MLPPREEADIAFHGCYQRGESAGPNASGGPLGMGEAEGEHRALVIGGLRVRGWTWLLSLVWVAAGTVITGYIFYATTSPFESADIDGTGSIGFSAGPAAVQIAAVLALVAWLALPVRC
jgi:hypothetical protein